MLRELNIYSRLLYLDDDLCHEYFLLFVLKLQYLIIIVRQRVYFIIC